MSNAELAKKITEKRRLAILYFLQDEPDLRMSVNLLQLALETYLIKGVNSDELTADTDYLRKAGLVTLEHIGPMPTLTLTQAGRETAKGARKVEGVQSPPLD